MRIIGVLDLLDGQAVHAVAGQRERYLPVKEFAGSSIEEGDALSLARAYLDRLRLAELYAADLDRILGRAPQSVLVSRLAALGAPLWLDAGVSSVDQAHQVFADGAARLVVGLETLPSFDVLQEICDAVGARNVAFSLDLRNGEPIVSPEAKLRSDEPAHLLAARAADRGVGALIVLDLARVGTGQGLDLEMIERVRIASPRSMLVAGGGVRGPEDLARLASAGCDAALVATALHNGRINAVDLARTNPSDDDAPD